MFGGPQFSTPALFSYDYNGNYYEVKKSDDGRLIGFLKNGTKNKFSLYLDDTDGNSTHLTKSIGDFIAQSEKHEEIAPLGLTFRMLSFILARKIKRVAVIYDAQRIRRDNPFYRSNNHSKCHLCDVAGWGHPKIMFLYVHRYRSESKIPTGGGSDKISFKHFFFPVNELENFQRALEKSGI
ncbi:MAG: hypothetical protein ABJ327_06390 [Litoreibacter sp.]